MRIFSVAIAIARFQADSRPACAIRSRQPLQRLSGNRMASQRVIDHDREIPHRQYPFI